LDEKDGRKERERKMSEQKVKLAHAQSISPPYIQIQIQQTKTEEKK
jgi:hypothetical protein